MQVFIYSIRVYLDNLIMKNAIKIICKRKNITLKQLSTDLHMPYRSIQNYASGVREPDFKTLSDIANYLNVTIDELINQDRYQVVPISKEDFEKIESLQNEINKIYAKYRK